MDAKVSKSNFKSFGDILIRHTDQASNAERATTGFCHHISIIWSQAARKSRV